MMLKLDELKQLKQVKTRKKNTTEGKFNGFTQLL